MSGAALCDRLAKPMVPFILDELKGNMSNSPKSDSMQPMEEPKQKKQKRNKGKDYLALTKPKVVTLNSLESTIASLQRKERFLLSF